LRRKFARAAAAPVAAAFQLRYRSAASGGTVVRILKILIVLGVVAALFGAGLFWLLTMPQTVAASALGPHKPNLANGKTLFEIGGCSSCHATPGQKDRTLLGGGMALNSPFGTFYPPNISSDPSDGIGGWSEAQFITAMTKGTSPKGEHLFPAFPYTSYQHITYNDLRDLFAYLKTLPAVKGRAPPHALPFPFNIRRLVGGWKLLFLDGLPFQPDPSQSDVWNRGAYLVNGPGHCAECHSPRNLMGGIIASERFAGGPAPDGKGWVPNITQKALAKWTADDIAYLLESGFTPDGDSVGSTMGEVVKNTSQLSEDDRKAISTYIKSLPPVDGPPRPKKKK
jgi:mono/diheme cytochrome c family protein